MRRWSWSVTAAALTAGAALAQAPAQAPAQTAPAPAARLAPPPGGYTQLFISPCGEPWRAGRADPYPVTLWFNATDTNHDGAIDKAEFRADHMGFFDALDRDGNGILDGTEISYYEQHVAPDVLLGRPFGALGPLPGARLWGGAVIKAQYGSLGSTPYSPGSAAGPTGDLGATRQSRQPLTGAAAFGFFADAEPLTATDTNLDGRISRAEFLEAADRRFKRLDRKGEGRLTLDALPKTQAQIQGVGRGKG